MELIQPKIKRKLAMSLALNQNYVTWSKNKLLPSNIHPIKSDSINLFFIPKAISIIQVLFLN